MERQRRRREKENEDKKQNLVVQTIGFFFKALGFIIWKLWQNIRPVLRVLIIVIYALWIPIALLIYYYLRGQLW